MGFIFHYGWDNSIVKWEKWSCQIDKIHFTTKGYKLTGDLFFEAFQNHTKNFRKNGEFDVSKFVEKIFSPSKSRNIR